MKDRTDRKTLPEALPAEQKEKNNRVKWYGVVWGIGLLIFQHSMYLLATVIAGWIGIPPFLPKIEAIDDLIPLVPVFVLPYIWSYFFWAMAPMAVSKCEKRYFYNFITAYICSCLFGMLIFIFAPSYMDRAGENLAELAGDSIFGDLLRFVYGLDGGTIAYNLFPSFHCMLSTLSYLGVMRRKEIPLWFRIYSLVTALLIYCSVVFTKQHYVVDIFGGIAIALVFYFLSTRFQWGRVWEQIERKFRRKGETKHEESNFN